MSEQSTQEVVRYIQKTQQAADQMKKEAVERFEDFSDKVGSPAAAQLLVGMYNTAVQLQFCDIDVSYSQQKTEKGTEFTLIAKVVVPEVKEDDGATAPADC